MPITFVHTHHSDTHTPHCPHMHTAAKWRRSSHASYTHNGYFLHAHATRTRCMCAFNHNGHTHIHYQLLSLSPPLRLLLHVIHRKCQSCREGEDTHVSMEANISNRYTCQTMWQILLFRHCGVSLVSLAYSSILSTNTGKTDGVMLELLISILQSAMQYSHTHTCWSARHSFRKVLYFRIITGLDDVCRICSLCS